MSESKLTMPYVLWRFLYWQKVKNLSYSEIDAKVKNGELIPCDDQVKDDQIEEKKG